MTNDSPDHCGSLCAPCAGGFGCTAGVCKTTCATSADCHPDYFCDATNAACHSDVISVACGLNHNCAALKDGRVMCWGSNDHGQLGIGTSAGVVGQVQVSGLGNATSVRATEDGSCALTNDGTARCWGNVTGMTDDPFSSLLVPVKAATGDLAGITFLELGFTAGCAVTGGGTYCWGVNSSTETNVGTLGFDPAMTTIAPAALLASTGVPSTLGMGYGYQVAAYGSNKVCPWGDGIAPQGQCFTVSSAVAQMAIGENTSCARLNSGAVICWGQNGSGQVGVNDVNTSVFPVPGQAVLGLNASDITAGAYHACAIPSGDPQIVVCWGDGLFQPTSVSINVPAGLKVERLGSGVSSYTNCAIISDGSLQCWFTTNQPLTATPVEATW